MDKINMDKIKRERSANFTFHERDILVSLIQKYQSVLENKQSDATTWKKKEVAWENIQNEFNARSGGTFRSTKTLKVKYEGLKRTVRKKSAAIRSELYRTGGGKSTAPPLDNVEEQIKSMITLSTDGLESIYDSDVLTQTQESQDVGDLKMEVLMEIPSLPNNVAFEVLDCDTQNQQISTNECECEPLPATDSTETDPKEMNIQLDNEHDRVLDVTPSMNCVITPSTSVSRKWDVTSRRNLKSRRHPALIANVQRKTAFDELTQAKLELIKKQKAILEFQEIEQKKEADFKDKERKWREEAYKISLEILRKQLNV